MIENKKLEQTMNSSDDKLYTTDVSDTCEQSQDNSGDLVPLVWMIEKLRRREGGCSMNEIIAEAKLNFKGIEQIKHRTINYL